MRKKIIYITVLVLVSVMFGVIVRTQTKQERYKQPAFTLISQSTKISPSDPNRKATGELTEYSFSDGSFHTIYKFGNISQESFFKYGMGFFRVNNKDKKIFKDSKMSSNAGGNAPKTAEQLQSSPQFFGKETLLGMTAYITRIKDENTGLPISDLYYTVETGNRLIKLVEYGSKGQVVGIDEPVKIIWGKPDASLKQVNYPIQEVNAE